MPYRRRTECWTEETNSGDAAGGCGCLIMLAALAATIVDPVLRPWRFDDPGDGALEKLLIGLALSVVLGVILGNYRQGCELNVRRRRLRRWWRFGGWSDEETRCVNDCSEVLLVTRQRWESESHGDSGYTETTLVTEQEPFLVVDTERIPLPPDWEAAEVARTLALPLTRRFEGAGARPAASPASEGDAGCLLVPPLIIIGGGMTFWLAFAGLSALLFQVGC